LVFGEDELTVQNDIKDTTMLRNKVGFYTEGFIKFVRQNDGPGSVVSPHAVMNINLHCFSLAPIASLVNMAYGETSGCKKVPFL
jgi:hypothetical protein